MLSILRIRYRLNRGEQNGSPFVMSSSFGEIDPREVLGPDSDVDEAWQEEKDPGNESAAMPCRSVRSTIPCPSLDDIPYPQRPAVFSGRDPHDRCPP
jgi:hypothetical protein